MNLDVSELNAPLVVSLDAATELYVTTYAACDEAQGLASGQSRALDDGSVISRVGDRVVWLTGLPVAARREAEVIAA
jgi:hypothetical protein